MMLAWPHQSDEEAFKILDAMQQEGATISAAALKVRLGGGSHGRLCRLVRQWQKRQDGLSLPSASLPSERRDQSRPALL
jgi:hypothetical protein